MNDETIQDAGDDAANAAEVSESNAEAERLRNENDELRHSIRMRDARDEMTRELAAAGARSPELIFASAKGDIQFDSDNKPANIAALIANLKRTFPEQFGTETSSNSIDAGAGARNTASFLTREALAKMKPAEIARLDWNDVRQVLTAG